MSTAVEQSRVAEAGQIAMGGWLLRVPLCALLFTAGALYEATHGTSIIAIANSNLWWHLRTGLWILQNHAVPHSGIYSQLADRPWISTSWFYDLLLGMGYRIFNLPFIPALLGMLRVAFAVLTFMLASGLRGKFWQAVLVSAVAQYVLSDLGPDPVLASVVLFGIELLVLFEFRRSGNVRDLFWLPPLFLVWANVDGQFVYGVLVLLLFGAASAIQHIPSHSRDPVSSRSGLRTSGIVLGASLLATLVTPYFYRPYSVFFASATSPANHYLPEYHALTFRRPQDYVLLLLVMFAFLALGMRRSRDPFQLSLLAICAALSFHLQRDAWLAVMASAAILGDGLATGSEPDARQSRKFWTPTRLVAAGLVVVLVTVAIALVPGRQVMLQKMRGTYPLAAADYVREHHLAQPLFNPPQWGGFLMWYLPEYPVSIDGRAELYNDDANIQYVKYLKADIPYSAYPPVTQARTLLLEKNSIPAQVLSGIPPFQVAYSDDVAMVLTQSVPEQ